MTNQPITQGYRINWTRGSSMAGHGTRQRNREDTRQYVKDLREEGPEVKNIKVWRIDHTRIPLDEL